MTFHESVTSVKENFFYGNKTLTDITIPATVEKIEKYAFSNCALTLKLHVTFGEGSEPERFDALWNNNLRDTKYETVYGGGNR